MAQISIQKLIGLGWVGRDGGRLGVISVTLQDPSEEESDEHMEMSELLRRDVDQTPSPPRRRQREPAYAQIQGVERPLEDPNQTEEYGSYDRLIRVREDIRRRNSNLSAKKDRLKKYENTKMPEGLDQSAETQL